MNLKTLVAILMIAAIAAGYLLWPSGYGQLSHPAYDLAIASYGACLAKSENRIDRIEALLDNPQFAQELSRQEEGWFRDLIAQARSQKWQRAANMARQMMQDQVRER